ncbi:MAG TPA: cytochrome P460 family protein [candidate division Zixibacteria bacterium]|nr:cytochrome P460 family protein [candidate division Zixibacteria bacterium]
MLKMNKWIIIAAGIVTIAGLLISYSFISTGDKASRDKYALTAPNGLSFSLIKGYENWHHVASHYRKDRSEIRFIMGNGKVIEAYREGAGKNGKPFPDGSILVKIGYSQKENPDWNSSIEPDALIRVEYMIKDSKRFNETYGWGYARFVYDVNTTTFEPYGKDRTFQNECSSCHVIVERKDYVFTDYVVR